MIRILLVLGVMLWAGAGNAEKAKKCMTAKDIAGGYFLVYSADKDGVVSDNSGIKWAIPYSVLPQIVDKLNKLDNLVYCIDRRIGDYSDPSDTMTMLPLSQQVMGMCGVIHDSLQRLGKIESRLSQIEERLKKIEQPNDYVIDCGRTGK